MKKWHFLTLMYLTVFNAQEMSGQLLNGGFEEWVTEHNYERPLHWNTNQDSTIARFERDTQRVEGSSSLKIISASVSAWQQCSSIASTSWSFLTPPGNHKALTFYARSLPIAPNTTDNVFLSVKGKLYSNGNLIGSYEWEAPGRMDVFEKVIIPMNFGFVDSMTAVIYGGAQNGATDGCHFRSVSWLDAFAIEDVDTGEVPGCVQKRAYEFGATDLFFTNMIMHQDTLIVSGIVNRDNSTNEKDLILIRMDTSGNLIDHFVYLDSLSSNFHPAFGEKKRGLLRSEDGGYVMLNEQSSDSYIVRLNNQGEKLWQRHYEDPFVNYNQFREIISSSGGYLVFGNKRALNSDSDIFVMKIDVEGNKLWEMKYGGENQLDDYLGDVLVLNSDEIVMLSTSNDNPPPGEEISYTTRITAIDSAGILKWQWDSDPGHIYFPRGLIRSDNQWSYAAFQYDTSTQNTTDGWPKFLKMDQAFNLLVEKELEVTSGSTNILYDVIPLSGGGYLGTGVNHEVEIPYSQTYAWMVRLRSDGQVMWERKDMVFSDRPHSTTQYLHSAVELSGGNLIVAGYTNTQNDAHAYGILIKLDKYGCFDTIFSTAVLGQVLPDKLQILSYPNPAHDYIIFESNESLKDAYVELYDLSGRRMLFTQFASNSNRINLTYDITPGIYLWRVFNESGEFLDANKIVILR